MFRWLLPLAMTACTMPDQNLARRATAVLVVDRIEPSLAFWTDGLGFTITAQVPDGDHLGFAMFEQGEVQIMLQTRGSVAADLPPLADRLGQTCIFLEVHDVDAVAARVPEAPVLMPRRETFYGMAEIVVETPGGHVVTLAQQLAPAAGN